MKTIIQFSIAFLFMIISAENQAQIIQPSNSIHNIQLGVSVNMGTVLKRAGIFIHYSYINRHIQINTRVEANYTIAAFGTLKSTPELQANLGLIYGYGKSQDSENTIFSPISNQTGYDYAGGLVYNLYFDKIGTSQRTGSIVLEFKGFGIVHENDMFGQRRSDKYRSAGVLLFYSYTDFFYATNVVLWHGDAFASETKRVRKSDYPAKFGYKDFSKSKYGKLSHGILTFQSRYALSSYQVLKLDIGIDSEYVRNFVQNKLIHEKWYLPDKYAGYELEHYPMLMKNGEPFLYKKGQKVRSSKFYFNFAQNPNIFY